MDIKFRLLVFALMCSLAGLSHGADDTPRLETAVCKSERQKIWEAESTETRGMAVDSYKDCLSNKAPLLTCRSEKAWCSKPRANNVDQCSPSRYPKTITFDLRTDQLQLELGHSDYGNTLGEITNFEVTGFTDIYHFRTEYFSGVSVVGFSRDMFVVTDYTSTLNTQDGYPRILGGDRDSCTRHAIETLKSEVSDLNSESHSSTAVETKNSVHDGLFAAANEGDAEEQFKPAIRFYEGAGVAQANTGATSWSRKC